MLDEVNAALLSEGNRVFCLVADVEVILERVLRRRSSRPMLAGPDASARVVALLNDRAEGYAVFEGVPTDERPPSRVVDEIIKRLQPT